MDAAARPFPKLDTTPPVTKTYFADIDATSLFSCCGWTYLVGTIKYGRVPSPRETEKWDGLRKSATNFCSKQLFLLPLGQHQTGIDVDCDWRE
jgi:hypothetical protein